LTLVSISSGCRAASQLCGPPSKKKRKQELATISKDINSSIASGSIAIDFHSALRPLKECRAQQSGQCLLTNMEKISFLKANIETLLK